MKTKKPAKRRASAGEKMVMKRLAKTLPGICNGIDDLRYKAVLEQPRSDAKEHDRAIRAAVRKRDVRWMDAMVLQGLSPNIMNGVFRRLQEIDP